MAPGIFFFRPLAESAFFQKSPSGQFYVGFSHFIARSRYNRLFSAIIENPAFQCIGINEGTAILVDGDSATVIGESQVFEIINPAVVKTADDTLLSAREIKVSIYLPGEKVEIKH